MDNDIGLKGLKRPRLYRRTTTCCKTKTLLWKNCFQDIRQGFFGGLDLTVDRGEVLHGSFLQLSALAKGAKKNKKEKELYTKNHIKKTSYLVPVRGCPYYILPDRAARGGERSFLFVTILSSCE